MRRAIVIATAALLAPTAAAANFWDGPGGNQPRARETGPVAFQPVPSQTSRNLDRAHDALKDRRESGELSRNEYRQLRRELRLIERLEQRYAFDGLSPGEQQELDFRSRHVLDVAQSRSVRR